MGPWWVVLIAAFGIWLGVCLIVLVALGALFALFARDPELGEDEALYNAHPYGNVTPLRNGRPT